MNGRSLPAVLWRRRWTALATVVLVALVTVAWLLLAPRRYTATSLITATPQRQLAGQSVTAHDLQATLAELARSVPVLVDARAQVGSQPSLAQPAGTQRPVAQRSVARRSVAQLQDEVHATLLRGTVLIRIAVTDADARYARDLANAIAEVLPKHDPSNGLFVFANAGRATAPTDFSAPDIAVAVWVGIAAAVVLALSSALARELFAGAVDEPAQLGRLGAAPVLATLPRASGPDSDGERFRALRVALEFATSDEPTHTVVIAPVTADETPGWVAVNLAVALAQVEHRVLVVDADVRAQNRDPALRSKGPGLIDVLLGEVELRDAVRPGPVTGVSVLPAGRVRGTTAANLIELNFHKALGRIENEVDLVLIVAAPLSESDDARVMSVGNALVVTVPAGRSRVATFRDAMAELRAMRLRVVGTVLLRRSGRPGRPRP